MDGLPKNINLKQLIDIELLQVCIGKFQCILNFDKDIYISIECDCLYNSKERGEVLISDFIDNASLVCSLIGSSISNVSRNDDGGLSIEFSNNVDLQLLNDTQMYESFQLNIKGDLFVA